MEMLKETGYCKGIENYSRFLDRRVPGAAPACLIDYFPKEFLMIMDESHIGVPQISGMIGGDVSRKKSLVDYGFRLPSLSIIVRNGLKNGRKRFVILSLLVRLPGEYELSHSGNVWADQVIRPTGLIDPEIEVKPVEHQIDDLLGEIHAEIAKGNRILITTLTKRMAESISEYYTEMGIKIEYLHSDIETVERMELICELRLGKFDALIGINLLREGLDIPEVGLVAILDGDKEGFLRDTRSLIQTIGRASRNVNGRAIIYADHRTDSIENAIKETYRRREKQITYNEGRHARGPVHALRQAASRDRPAIFGLCQGTCERVASCQSRWHRPNARGQVAFPAPKVPAARRFPKRQATSDKPLPPDGRLRR